MRVLVDDLYVLVGVAHDEKHKGVWLIGVPYKNAVFAMFMGLSKQFKA